MSQPHSQWSFVNIEKVLPTAIVKKSTSPAKLAESKHDFKSFGLLHNDGKVDLGSYMARSNMDGLMILQHGRVLYEEYFHGNTRDSPHILFSVTKSVTSLLVGILQTQGKLSVDEPVTKYVPEVSNTIWKNATIQQCLDMRSGAKYVDGTHEYRAAAAWHPMKGGERYATLKDFLAHFEPQEVIDDRFEYVSANTDLVGWVIERATNKTYCQVLEELLWHPMGAEHDAFITVDSEGFARAAGGLCTTLPDLARLAQLILSDGKNADGEVVVPASWINDILHNGSKDAWQRGVFAPAFTGAYDSMAYRSFCYADEDSETLMGIGSYGQHFAVDKKNGIVLVTTASQESAVDFEKFGMTMSAFKEIRRALLAA